MELIYAYQEWPYRETFRISRGDSVCSELFVAWIREDGVVGRGECSILTQYGHTRQEVQAAFEDAIARLPASGDKAAWLAATSNSSVRSALDCALLDLECKKSGRSIWEIVSVDRLPSIEVDLTISVNPIEKMCADARRAADRGFRTLKLKADGEQVVERVASIARCVPGVRFIVDANEAWTIDILRRVDTALHQLGVILIEQPLHHERDEALSNYRGPIPICADESCHAGSDLDQLAARYQAINIKLDKVGGLTPGLALARAAKARDMKLMMGCAGPTSLGIAPGYVIGTLADYVDLDVPALLLDDRANAMTYQDGRLNVFSPALWG